MCNNLDKLCQELGFGESLKLNRFQYREFSREISNYHERLFHEYKKYRTLIDYCTSHKNKKLIKSIDKYFEVSELVDILENGEKMVENIRSTSILYEENGAREFLKKLKHDVLMHQMFILIGVHSGIGTQKEKEIKFDE